MLCYHTHLKVNNEFNQDILYDMFFNWLQTTKNKMNNLDFNNQLPFSFEVNNKKLIICEYNEPDFLVIYFTTSQNGKKNRFTVEILYSKTACTLDLNFYITISSQSKYFQNVSIPQIFRTLMNSPYILKDHSFHIDDQPIMMNKIQYQQINQTQYDLPLVILHSNQYSKNCIHPYKLARELIGIAHVICIKNSDKNLFTTIKILYPNNQTDSQVINLQTNEKVIIHYLSSKLRNYYIQEKKHDYSLQKLQELELRTQHQSTVEDNKQLQIDFSHEIQEKKDELEIFYSLYQELLSKRNQLIHKNNDLKNHISRSKEEPLIIMDKEQVYDVQEFLISFIEKQLQNFDPTETYRKRTVLQSILQKNK